MTRPRQRRTGTVPHRTYWSADIIPAIDAYQQQHQLASFSAAAEALVRLGLTQSPAEVLTPIVEAAVYTTLRREMSRLAKLQLYGAIEAGMARRFAAAALRDLGRIMTDADRQSNSGAPRFHRIKAHIHTDTRRTLKRTAISSTIADVYADELPQVADDDTVDGGRFDPAMDQVQVD